MRWICIRRATAAAMVLGLGLLMTGCPTNPPETVPSVDLERYAGKWYEIAKYPVFFENGLAGVTAEYTLMNDGTVQVINRGFQGSLDGNATSIQGTATISDATTNAKLKVRFDTFPANLFPADYWIIALDSDYQHAVVSNPFRNVLWILNRTPQMDAGTYSDILSNLSDDGFDVTKLELTPQPAI